MKRQATEAGINPPLQNALSQALAVVADLNVEMTASRRPTSSPSPSMRIPQTQLGVNASDGAVELPGIIERNRNDGFYPAQDGYARNPETNEELRLAGSSQYGIDWQRQQRERQMLLDRDPMHRFLKALAGASASRLDRYLQGPNREIIDIQRQRALERARREIRIYGPDFKELETRIINMKAQKVEVEKSDLEWQEKLKKTNDTMKNVYADAKAASEKGNPWVLPSDGGILTTDHYSGIEIDLSQIFAGDTRANIRVADVSLGQLLKRIHVFPFLRIHTTIGLLNIIHRYNNADIMQMDSRYVMMVAFIIMNGGMYSDETYTAFIRQFEECKSELDGIGEGTARKRAVLAAALKNWYSRAYSKNGDIYADLVALDYLAATRKSDADDTVFKNITGLDYAIMYRTTGDRGTLWDELEAPDHDKISGIQTRALTLKELCSASNNDDITRENVNTYVTAILATMEEAATVFTQDNMAGLFGAWLYFLLYFLAYVDKVTDVSAAGTALKKILDITKYETPTFDASAASIRSIIDTANVPISPFVASSGVSLYEGVFSVNTILRLATYMKILRENVVSKTRATINTSKEIADAIRSAEQRLVTMTMENYDTVKSRIDELISEGIFDVTPSLYAMGNSIDYATQPANIGFIVLTPLAQYGIGISYAYLQDRSIPGNQLAGLPFDAIITDSELTFAFAKFVAAILASTGLATGSGYQAQVRSNRIPYEVIASTSTVFSYGYSIVSRDPLTGEYLSLPRYNIFRKNTQSYGMRYLL